MTNRSLHYVARSVVILLASLIVLAGKTAAAQTPVPPLLATAEASVVLPVAPADAPWTEAEAAFFKSAGIAQKVLGYGIKDFNAHMDLAIQNNALIDDAAWKDRLQVIFFEIKLGGDGLLKMKTAPTPRLRPVAKQYVQLGKYAKEMAKQCDRWISTTRTKAGSTLCGTALSNTAATVKKVLEEVNKIAPQ